MLLTVSCFPSPLKNFVWQSRIWYVDHFDNIICSSTKISYFILCAGRIRFLLSSWPFLLLPDTGSSSKKSAKKGCFTPFRGSEDFIPWWNEHGSKVHAGAGCDYCGVRASIMFFLSPSWLDNYNLYIHAKLVWQIFVKINAVFMLHFFGVRHTSCIILSSDCLVSCIIRDIIESKSAKTLCYCCL